MNRYIDNDKYTTPKLCNRGGDITKPWYVYFFFTQDGIRKQIRVKRGINLVKDKKEREFYGRSLVKAVSLDLADGWNPITLEQDVPPEDKTVKQALEDILALKKSYITERSYRTYKDNLKLFYSWLEKFNLDRLFIHNFTRHHAQQYLDWLLRDRNYCGKTHNGYLGSMSTFFAAIEERNKAVKNPFKGIKSLPEDVGKNTTYSSDEEKLIDEYLLKNDFNFYLATRFIKYCFFRRTELSKLQVKHIKWENKTIVVPAKSSKNRNQDSITIPLSFESILIKSGILNLDPEMYIFGHPGKYFKPSLIKIKRLDDFSDRQREINQLLGVKAECSFYSYKHTGVCELYKLTKDPYTVMRQCRHSDIKITMKYLRSLGLGVNEQVRGW